MSALLGIVRRTLAERPLLAGATRIVVGCSGGPDSQALLHVLAALREQHGCAFHAASVHHGLRADADRDVAVAAELAARLAVPFHALRVTVARTASLQANARAARYAALFGLARELGAQRVAVAHTLDDQAETVLGRLLRGTGVLGLGAIDIARPDGLVRPMLEARRADVLSYIAEHDLPHVIDPSNADPRYLRARVRHTHLPALRAENPRLDVQLAALADDAAGAAEVLHAHADAVLTRCAGSLRGLRDESAFTQRLVLQRWCETRFHLRPARRQLEALAKLVHGPGEVRFEGDRSVRADASGTLSVVASSKRGRGRARQCGERDPDEPAEREPALEQDE